MCPSNFARYLEVGSSTKATCSSYRAQDIKNQPLVKSSIIPKYLGQVFTYTQQLAKLVSMQNCQKSSICNIKVVKTEIFLMRVGGDATNKFQLIFLNEVPSTSESNTQCNQSKIPCIIQKDPESNDATNSHVVPDISDNGGGIGNFNFSEIAHGDYVIVQYSPQTWG